MKPILLLSALVLFAQQVAVAQFEKGTTIINGSLRLQFNEGTPSSIATNNSIINRDKTTFYQWNFAPEVGKMISKNIMVGIGLSANGFKNSYNYASTNNGITDVVKFTRGGSGYGGYLFTRKYLTILENLRCYMGVELGSFYNTNNDKRLTNGVLNANNQSASSNTNLALNSGVELAVTKHWLVQVGLNNFLAANYNMNIKNQNYQYDAAGVITNYYTVTGGSSFNLAAGLATSLFNFGVAYCLLPKVKSQPITPVAK